MASKFKIPHLKFKTAPLGFTLTELLVVIAIIAVLSVASYVGIQRYQLRTMNEKVTSDLLAIRDALNQYKEDNQGEYPTFNDLSLSGNKNVLCFNADMSYAHDCATAAFLQTQVDNTLLTKRYLQEVPVDPRTGSRYAYGVTADGKSFQLAGIQQQKGDTWQARVIGNLDGNTAFPGLIRAFDAPNFVMDEGSFLPYSQNPLQVTARLNGVVGTVMVNGAATTEGQVMQVGDAVKTGPASTVILYLSDGSITYLDENSELRLLPSSEVVENSKDDIITKIRMKLFQGSTWNKVIRLADQSEFNIETTSAIAGVRGTEFGLNAKTNEVTVLSGSVATCLKTTDEVAQSNGEGKFLEFTVDDAFLLSQDAESDGELFKVFSIPQKGQAVGPPQVLTEMEASEYKLKYYQNELGLSAGYTPYIVKAQAHANGSYTIYVTFNGVESNNDFSLDTFDVYGESQTTDIRTLSETAKPLLTVKKVTYDDQEKAYAFELPTYAKKPNDPLYNQTEDRMESLLVQASYELEGKPIYSQLSWPPIGLQPEPKEEYAYTFDNAETYQNLEDLKQVEFLKIDEIADPTVALNEGSFPLSANQPCNWSVEPASSGAFQKSEGLTSADYFPLKPDLPPADLALNVTTRFVKASTEKVTIRCTDPNDEAKFDEAVLTVNYAPKSVSDSYQYGYTAKAGTSWTEAHKACDDSTEGGFTEWTLPSKIVYEGVDLKKEKGNLCKFLGDSCNDLKDVNNFYFQEKNKDSGYLLFMKAEMFGPTPKDFIQPAGAFHCVKTN